VDPRSSISRWKKICYAVIMGARKLRHYFEAHVVKVLTNQPLGNIFKNRDITGRISKWALELSKHIIDFEKPSAIKSQVLTDFVVEWMKPASVVEGEVPESPWLAGNRGWISSHPHFTFGNQAALRSKTIV
jgi:hypothetical protein